MTRKTLITWSVIRDLLDFMVVGQIPGLGQLLDVPILMMHYAYAGANANFALPELIPTVGFLPIFTIAACCYPDPDAARQVLPVDASAHQRVDLPPKSEAMLFAQVDGKVVPIDLTPDQQAQVAFHVNGGNVGARHA